MAAKKKKQPAQLPLSPRKFVQTRARNLPIYKCFINSNWREAGMASIFVFRRHVNGNITAGMYQVDLLARGVKDTFFRFNNDESELMEAVERSEMEETDYALVHNIIYGALAFAEEYNFRPHPEFAVTSHILEEDTEDIPLIELDFGMNGKPVIM